MKKPKRPSRKPEQIIHTAERLFSRFGARRVTVEEICRESGVSKVTFYKYFQNKIALIRRIRDNWVEEGFRKFDEINALDIPLPETIDLMTSWKAAFGSRVGAGFIRDMVSIDHVVDETKRRYLANIAEARKRGDVRDDINLEFLWMVTEKLYDLVREDTWKTVFSDFGLFQEQLRTLIFYGLLARPEKEGKP